MKISIVVGTRPQIIKSQPLIKELLSRKVKISIVHTGQHYDFEMSKAFFNEMKIKNPDYNLGINQGSPSKQLAQIISKLEKPLKKFKPNVVVVPGDTRSALGAALCATRLGFKTAHLEAGTRSNDFTMEEEINRRIIDHCSHLLFAPTKNCYKNLKQESVLGKQYFTGDTMYDVFLEYKKLLKQKKSVQSNFVLMTIHRKNNIENYSKIKNILQLAKKIENYGLDVIFPMHPHTKKQIKSFGLSLKGNHIIKPVKYSKMLQLLHDSNLLITDSGGLQKEAFWLNIPCITLRENTEWIETLEGKCNVLLRNVSNSSFNLVKKTMSRKYLWNNNSIAAKFGNGKASKNIASIILD